MKTSVYLDHNATTPISKEVLEYVASLMKEPANASSLHSSGRWAKSVVESARKSIMQALNIDHINYDVIFTASGTETNNTVINSFSDYHLFVSPIEHSSVMKIAEKSKNVTFLKVDEEGVIDENFLVEVLQSSNSQKKLVTIGHANSETGVIQDIKKLASVAHENGAVFHSDMVQSFGKIPVNIRDLDIDMATISSHKIGGMIGAASLVKKAEIYIKPLIVGGGQERGFRAGTENTYAIASFGKASELFDFSAYQKISILRDYLESEIQKIDPISKIYSKNADRLANTSYISMPNVDNQTQLMNFDIKGFCVSAGSACSSGVVGESHVLKAMNPTDKYKKNAIRISLGNGTTKAEIDSFIKAWKEVHESLSNTENKKEAEANYG